VGVPLFWSVERDGDSVVAICPEPLRAPSASRPGWMEHCAAAIRDELRLLAVEEGTLLAATLTSHPAGAVLESALLASRAVPQAHVHDGVRFRLEPAAERGVELRYRREPIAASEPTEASVVAATLLVPATPAYELEDATARWLAARPSGVERGDRLALHARFIAGAADVYGSVEFIEALLASARSALDAGGPALEIRTVELVFAPGETAQLEVELRVLAPA
jgi:hypothetical protein